MPLATSRRRIRAAILAATTLLAVVVSLSGPAVASASPSQFSIMMDDNLLVYGSNTTRVIALQQMRSLGVDAVRVTLLWSAVAKGTKDPATHRRFDPTNSADYPRGVWVPYDQLVLEAKTFGIAVYFDITGPGPAWAMGKTTDPKEKASYKPNVGQFAKFVRAAGTRFSGNFKVGKTVLPKVSLWSIWNEPNQVGWLSPQGVYNSQLHAVIPYSPILYRQIFYAARGALNATGHASDVVLAGETAPLGSPPQNGRTPMRPAQFIREFFCVNGHLKPYAGVQASVRGCSFWRHHKALPAVGWAHHPYTKTEPPTWRDKSPDSIVISNISALPKLLDKIAASTHRVATGMQAWITEMGYETNPPDPFRGVAPDQESAWDNEADFMAYQQPRVAAVTQFLLEDAGPNKHFKRGTRGYWDTYQSGLEWGLGSGFAPGAQKPAYFAYAFPFWITTTGPPSSPEIDMWAWVRFRAFGVAPTDRVVFQFQPQGSTTWITDSPGEQPTPYGFVNLLVPENAYGTPGMWRAAYLPATGSPIYSRAAPYPS